MAKRREPPRESSVGEAGGKKPGGFRVRGPRQVAARVAKARPDALPLAPNVCLVRAPRHAASAAPMGSELTVATYNVHRWTGLNGRRDPDPARAAFVISELGADVIALQEVLRLETEEDPLERLADALGLFLAFAATRIHRFGALGNAILSRWPIPTVSTLDLSFSRLEKRLAVAASFDAPAGALAVVATHLALVDRTRHQQVQSLLEHPQLRTGSAILLGDMNAWRQCRATRALDAALGAHDNQAWPSSFPAARPVLALDRIYARGARIVEIHAHDSLAARRASDHLPVVAHVELPRVH
jgi:endonuclease/exonuclease/phosphatase family metal-dependent hydrolase